MLGILLFSLFSLADVNSSSGWLEAYEGQQSLIAGNLGFDGCRLYFGLSAPQEKWVSISKSKTRFYLSGEQVFFGPDKSNVQMRMVDYKTGETLTVRFRNADTDALFIGQPYEYEYMQADSDRPRTYCRDLKFLTSRSETP